MDATQRIGERKPSLLTVLTRLLAAAFIALGTVIFAAFMFLIVVRTIYINRALPGISLPGISLTGLRHEQIVTVLETRFTYPEDGTLVLTDGELAWMMPPSELGVRVDFDALATRALACAGNGSPP